ncbi:NUDIX domain-containing protein [Alkalispirochaeta sphaeroplastigenens]|uniref:NUDIX domain-containing protein n=1 Tax=Alkalispirochaeta sphaeroplastigenens TaxID=1187066 RepID=UPI0015E19ED2|nr:NUDIX domain-containing protein [Alkalispirochaeta sphaeroplastigenens]
MGTDSAGPGGCCCGPSGGKLFRQGRLVTTAAVAYQEGRFFAAQRKKTGAQPLRWEFPGGKCDEGDPDERSCLEREFREEFGVSVTVGDEAGSIPFDHKGVSYVLVGYWVQIPPEPLVLREHVQAGWYTPKELLELDLSDSDRSLVEEILPLVESSRR